MSPSNWPITISTATDDICAGVCLWRQRQTPFATAAVKATFTLVPGATMTLRAPLPIESLERQVSAAEGIEPGDLAPCLVQPEIWVRGHAWFPPAAGAPSVRIRLIVARDGQPLVRKTVELPIHSGAPFLHALAPLSRKWPVRTRLLGAFDWTNLDRSPIELPDVFDWTYFHAAPADQQLGPLRGDEWIRLEGIHSTIHKFDTQLPSATCAVTMFGPVDRLRDGSPLRFGLDTVQLDVDRGTCALVFRGHTPLPANVSLEDLQFVAGLGLPERPMAKLEPKSTKTQVSSALETASTDQTLFVDASAILREIVAQHALPFQGDASPLATSTPQTPAPRSNDDAGQTFMLDERLLRTLNEKDALPFHESLSVSSSSAPNTSSVNEPARLPEVMLVPDVPIAPPASLSPPVGLVPPTLDAASTFLLSDEMLAQIVGAQATPFAGGEPLPEREEPTDVLVGLPFQPVSEDEPAPGWLGAAFLRAIEASIRGKGQPSVQAELSRRT